MTGIEFEHQCAEILRGEGYTGVEVTQASGDQGIDVLAKKDGIKYAIQCKYYASPVGNAAVQQAYAGKTYYNCDVAMVMTNTTFTKSARELADSTGVVLWEYVDNNASTSKPRTFRGTVCRVINWVIGLLTALMALLTWLTISYTNDEEFVAEYGPGVVRSNIIALIISALVYIALIVFLIWLKRRIRKPRDASAGYLQETSTNDEYEIETPAEYQIDDYSETESAAQDNDYLEAEEMFNSQFENEDEEMEYPEIDEAIWTVQTADRIMNDAIGIVVDYGEASRELLQRQLKVSYNRANLLLGEMQMGGIIGPENGDRPREVFCYDPAKVRIEYDPNYTYEPNDEIQDTYTLDDNELLKSLGIKRAEKTVSLNDIVQKDATLLTNATHDFRLKIVDMIVSKTSYENDKMLLIDTQGFYKIYDGIQNLLIPVVTDSSRLEVFADWLNHEYADRVDKLAKKRARSMEQYNTTCSDENRLTGILVVVYDIDTDGVLIDSLDQGTVLHCGVTGIHIVVFGNNSKSQNAKKAIKQGFSLKELEQ